MGLKGFACGIAFSLFLAQGQAFAGKANDTLVYASDTEPENVSPYHNDAREGVILAHLAWDTLIYRDRFFHKQDAVLFRESREKMLRALPNEVPTQMTDTNEITHTQPALIHNVIIQYRKETGRMRVQSEKNSF